MKHTVRHLVSQGQVERTIQDMLGNLQRYGNSFGKSDRMRAKWTQTSGLKIKDARKEAVEYLWFVGDYASYDPRCEDITKKTANVFAQAGLDFGLLYEAERNAGNDVRRVGEEGLFEMLRDKNQQAFAKAKFQKIVTTDPHTYHTLKNEYPWNGNRPEVRHYTEALDGLIQAGKLPLKKKLSGRVTYDRLHRLMTVPQPASLVAATLIDLYLGLGRLPEALSDRKRARAALR